ncbi:MAG TPA: cytochrome c biogenesis protein ResB [Verrucomicrobiae bacterium]|nr:cytochrome c biogenesis protein ResB [Verrucomicrobiae bacterium]
MQNRLLRLLGSLKLAVVVLLLLAMGMAAGTILESRESSRVAAEVVYRSWWFNGLMALLAINVAAAALTRWPWKRRHVGFVITHAGIIILLGGCSAAYHYGTEGMMERRVGDPPSNLVRIDDQALTVVVPETGGRSQTVLRINNNDTVKPAAIRVEKDLRLTLDKFLPNTRVTQLVKDGGEEFNPALQFRLKSDMAGQDVSDWLLAASPERNHASIGPAQFEFVVAKNEAEVKNLLAPPENGSQEPTITIRVDGKDFGFNAAKNVDKPLRLGDTDVSAHIAGYWPDFKLDENHKPATASNEPNNPAAVVILSRGEDEERQFVFATGKGDPIIRVIKGNSIGAQVQLSGATPKQPSGVITVVLAPDGTLHYAVTAKEGFKSGPVKVGEPVATGWMDFEFTPVKFVANAIAADRIEPATAVPDANWPALQVTAHSGDQQQSAWVRFGQPVALIVGGKTVDVMYGWDSMQLPFTVELEDFIVERDEGSTDVAGWTSKVIFRDDVRGLTQRASIWMNHPAWFKGYKFSQASWNPNDLKYTALQVKKDPMWMAYLTWTGAILIIGGIALMFWGRGWLQKREENEKPRAERRRGKGKERETREAVTA